jgi:preprotein translocase subunit SecA
MRRSLTRISLFSPSKKILKKARNVAKLVDAKKDEFRKMSNAQLTKNTQIYIQRIASGESLDSVMVEAFANVREAVYRTKGMFAYAVQLIGASVIH